MEHSNTYLHKRMMMHRVRADMAKARDVPGARSYIQVGKRAGNCTEKTLPLYGYGEEILTQVRSAIIGQYLIA